MRGEPGTAAGGTAAGHAEWFLRLGTPGGYSPDRLLGRAGLRGAGGGGQGHQYNQVPSARGWA